MADDINRARSRSHSPSRHQRKRRRHYSRSPRRKNPDTSRQALPFEAIELSKHQLSTYKPMFAFYLDIQKQIDIDDLSEDEVKGRWKSFIGKWNRGELAEGWYDPKTLEKAVSTATRLEDDYASNPPRNKYDEDEDDDYGPTLPSSQGRSDLRLRDTTQESGPSIPSMQELRVRREEAEEEAATAREEYIENIRHERKVDRKLQKDRLDELVPKAEAGTRERQIEKKREKASSNIAFAASKDGGEMDLRDADVMGDEDNLSDLKRMKKEQERKKNDREIRREETLRARRAEREERLAGMRAKEEKTMAMLKEIARARFGGVGD